MNSGMIKTGAFLATLSLSLSGCQNMTPGENAAVFGSLSGVAAGTIARASGMSTAQSLALGAAVGTVVAATTYVVGKHQATERQRRLAEEHARIYYGRLSPEKKVAMRTRKTRYIAVDTAKDERTAPNAQKSVMIWDTQSQQVVGNNVYDVQSAPRVGSTAKFDTYSAEYVGNGS
jgi:hypothetical protein